MPGLGLGLGLRNNKAAGGAVPAPPPASVSIAGSFIVGETLTAIAIGAITITGYLWERVWEDYTETAYTTQAIELGYPDMGYFLRVTVFYSSDDGPGTLTATTANYVRDIDFPGSGSITKSGKALYGMIGDLNGLRDFQAIGWERSPDGSNWEALENAAGLDFVLYVLSAEGLGYSYRFVATYSDYQDYQTTVTSEAFGPVVNSPGYVVIDGNISAPTAGDQLSATVPIDLDGWTFGADTPIYNWRSATSTDGPWVPVVQNSYLTISPDLASKYLQLEVIFHDDLGTLETFYSEVFGPILNSNSAGSISINSNYRIGSSLYALLSDPDGVTYPINFLWERAVSGGWETLSETGEQFYPAEGDRGSTFRVTASYIDGGGFAEVLTSQAAYIPYGQIDINLEFPVLVGDTLISTITTPNGTTGPIVYQWWRLDVATGQTQAIAGATGSSYVPVPEDAGYGIFVTATYTDSLGQTETVYSTLANVVAVTSGGTLTINGSRSAGQQLTAVVEDPEGLSGDLISYDWQRSTDGVIWVPALLIFSPVFTLPSDSAGFVYRLVVSYVDQANNYEVLISEVGTIAAADTAGSASITGLVAYGNTVEGTIADPDSVASVSSRQWQRSPDNGVTWIAITGATSATYTISGNLLNGNRIRFTATYTDGLGNSGTVASAASDVIIVPDAAGFLVIQGELLEFQELNAAIFDGNGVLFNSDSYQWQYGYSEAGPWFEVVGTHQKFTVPSGYGDTYLRATATYTDLAGYSATISQAVGPIGYSSNSTRAATIDGYPPQIGHTLTASMVEVNGVSGAVAWRWQSSADDGDTWQTIAGATAQTFVPMADQGDRLIRVQAIYIDNLGNARTVSSPPTWYINIPATAGATGLAKVGAILSGAVGDENGIGGAVSNQWEEYDNSFGWIAIPGETANYYTIPVSKVGGFIRYVGTFTDSRGYDEIAFSNQIGPIAA